jgi:hypothetical protein
MSATLRLVENQPRDPAPDRLRRVLVRLALVRIHREAREAAPLGAGPDARV